MRTLACCLTLSFSLATCSYAQSSGGNSGTVRGTVLDPSGAAIAGASVEIENPVSHYKQTTKTDDQGNFALNNIPLNNYHVTANASGFERGTQELEVRSTVPLDMKINLKIGTESSSVTVIGPAICWKQTPSLTPTLIAASSTSCLSKASLHPSARW